MAGLRIIGPSYEQVEQLVLFFVVVEDKVHFLCKAEVQFSLTMCDETKVATSSLMQHKYHHTFSDQSPRLQSLCGFIFI